MNKQITVFTPTYNRAHTLIDCYTSLKSQTVKDFVWLIVDDGSFDNTKELVSEWLEEKSIDIRYTRKENGGMHTAHNKAFELIDTELCFCLDSDDDLLPTSIEEILNFWNKVEAKEKFAGIVANECYRTSGKVIGTEFPSNLSSTSFYDMYYKYKIQGDKLLVYRSELISKHPYKEFKGERFVPLDFSYLLIDEPLAILNKCIYKKEYLEEGHSRNLKKTYARNPNGYGFYHKFRMTKVGVLSVKIKSVIHYIGTSRLAGHKNIIANSPLKALTILLYPLGLIWYFQLLKVKNSLPPMERSDI